MKKKVFPNLFCCSVGFLLKRNALKEIRGLRTRYKRNKKQKILNRKIKIISKKAVVTEETKIARQCDILISCPSDSCLALTRLIDPNDHVSCEWSDERQSKCFDT